MRADAGRLAFRGRTASIGFAHGQFVRVNAGASGKRAAGSPLAAEQFDFVYRAIAPDLHLASISGGTMKEGSSYET